MKLKDVSEILNSEFMYQKISDMFDFDPISRTENNLADPVGVLVHDELCLAVRQTIFEWPDA